MPESDQQFDAGPLKNFDFESADAFYRVSLAECIEHALQDSEVIRELGGTVLRAPESVRSASDPALAYTDPAFGEEAALSEFDARFSNQFLFQNNDRAFNSSFIGDQGALTQDTATNITNLSKLSATGALFQLNHQFVFDRNNTPANRFANNTSYDNFLTAEFRQPLLQGAGAAFNRIAGPGNPVGINNGVLIARTNTDISLADFELGIRNLVSDVENAYWDLYFAYRDLEAKIEARNGAYELWKNQDAQKGDKSSTEVLQAEEQYYLFATQVENAIYGQLNDGTRTNNGSSSGTFRGTPGIRTAERRLRLLTGLRINDTQLLLPNDPPIDARVVFDWEQAKTEALALRAELRRQRWVLKRAELNLLANRKLLQPRLDLVGRYRIRGFGNDLLGDQGFDARIPPNDPFVGSQDGSDALATFFNGDLQEWELGADVNIPIGYRRENAAIRNSELSMMRETKILREQEREIVYGLSNAIGELDRVEALLDLSEKRLLASEGQFNNIQVLFEDKDTTIDLVLESQRRVIDAKISFHRAQVEWMLAVKAVHFEKGTGLEYHNVLLAEKGWAQSENAQAAMRERIASPPLNYAFRTLEVSYPQFQSPVPIAGAPVQEYQPGLPDTVLHQGHLPESQTHPSHYPETLPIELNSQGFQQ